MWIFVEQHIFFATEETGFLVTVTLRFKLREVIFVKYLVEYLAPWRLRPYLFCSLLDAKHWAQCLANNRDYGMNEWTNKQTSTDLLSFNHILSPLSVDKKTCLLRLVQCPAHSIYSIYICWWWGWWQTDRAHSSWSNYDGTEWFFFSFQQGLTFSIGWIVSPSGSTF